MEARDYAASENSVCSGITESDCLKIAMRAAYPADRATAFLVAAVLALRDDRDGVTLRELVEHIESADGKAQWGLDL